ncbi:hypothetical protein VNO77_42820 [Canavalia gladiata]|uniref:Uncharacterized protein n=1 Tax=Canavalia gladiata TaxID=3824 RepID=A0AAN9PNU0_CANGL
MLESDISKERRISKTPRNCSISAKDLGEFFECSGLQLLGDLSHLKKGLEDMDCFSLLPSLAGRNLEVVALSLSLSLSLSILDQIKENKLHAYVLISVYDDSIESFVKAKKDLELTLASEALHAGYDYDEKVYAAAKAVDVGMIEYDSDDNLIIVDEKKIEPIPPLDHSSIDYEPFNKAFIRSPLQYQQKTSSGKTTAFVLPMTVHTIRRSVWTRILHQSYTSGRLGREVNFDKAWVNACLKLIPMLHRLASDTHEAYSGTCTTIKPSALQLHSAPCTWAIVRRQIPLEMGHTSSSSNSAKMSTFNANGSRLMPILINWAILIKPKIHGNSN